MSVPLTDNNFIVCSKTTSLDHLKRFWTKSLTILNSLEKEWELSNHKERVMRWNHQKVRCLFNCYELIIICTDVKLFIEFNEYCEVLELQNLGKCILKMFIQMISIVESLFKCGFEYDVSNGRDSEDMLTSQSITKVEAMAKNEEKAQANDENKLRVFNGMSREYFVEKEKTKNKVMRVEEEFNNFVSSYEENISAIKKESFKIHQNKEKAINLEPSNAEYLISEACMMIENKYDSLVDFMEIRNKKIQIEQQKDYKNVLTEIIEEVENEKTNVYNEASKKIMAIVENYLFAKEKEKKLKSKNNYTQTDAEPIQHTTSLALYRERLKLKEEELKSTKLEIKNEKSKNQSLERLLKQKTEQYEKEITKQQINVKKLEQRVSIVSKFSQKETLNMEFINSSHSIIREEHSQKSEKSLRLSKESSEKIISRKSYDRQPYDRRVSKGRPSREKFSLLPNFDHRRSSRFQSLKEKTKFVKLSISSKVFEVEMQPFCLLSCIDLEMAPISKCNASIQTDFRLKEGVKERVKAEKNVTFKTELRFYDLYSITIEPIARDPGLREISNYLNESRGFSTLLKKKKGNPDWNKVRNHAIQSFENCEEDFFVPRRSYSKVEINAREKKEKMVSFQKLCIGLTEEQVCEIDRKQADSLKQMKTKVKTKIPELSALTFNKEDINLLFMDSEKAADFEFLNFNMGTQKSRFENFEILKTHQYMVIAGSSPEKLSELQSLHSHHRHSKLSRRHSTIAPTSQNELIIQTVYRHLNFVKYSSHEKYEKIRNFLRFPNSSIDKNKDHKWILLSKQESEIGINELRKIFKRIERVHNDCQKNSIQICQHIIEWMEKIGISLGEEKK